MKYVGARGASLVRSFRGGRRVSRIVNQSVAVSLAAVLLVCGLLSSGQESAREQRTVIAKSISPVEPITEAQRVAFVSFADENDQADENAGPRNMQSARNLRKMAHALHLYHDAHGVFPAGYSADSEGRALLSWRVHILPQLGAADLYQQFHLDESWDSPRNKPLIDKMPRIYRSSRSKAQPGRSSYLGVSGVDGVFLRPGNGDKEGIGIRHIKDGSSNTILAIEVPDDWAIVWTKPGDFAPTPRRLQRLQELPVGFQVVMADGRARFLPAPVDQQLLRALFSKFGREPTNLP